MLLVEVIDRILNPSIKDTYTYRSVAIVRETRNRTDPISGFANNGDAPAPVRCAGGCPVKSQGRPASGSADNAVLDDLTLDYHLDHLASLREHCSRDPGAATSAGAGPRQRDDPGTGRGDRPGAGDTASARCPPGLHPLSWRCERGGGFLNGESEDGGRLELWLSLARRASNSRMRSRRCAMSAVCSATRSRSRLSSSSGFSGEWVAVGYSSMGIDYVCSLPLGKRS